MTTPWATRVEDHEGFSQRAIPDVVHSGVFPHTSSSANYQHGAAAHHDAQQQQQQPRTSGPSSETVLRRQNAFLQQTLASLLHTNVGKPRHITGMMRPPMATAAVEPPPIMAPIPQPPPHMVLAPHHAPGSAAWVRIPTAPTATRAAPPFHPSVLSPRRKPRNEDVDVDVNVNVTPEMFMEGESSYEPSRVMPHGMARAVPCHFPKEQPSQQELFLFRQSRKPQKQATRKNKKQDKPPKKKKISSKQKLAPAKVPPARGPPAKTGKDAAIIIPTPVRAALPKAKSNEDGSIGGIPPNHPLHPLLAVLRQQSPAASGTDAGQHKEEEEKTLSRSMIAPPRGVTTVTEEEYYSAGFGRALPTDYVLGEYDVVCQGRGRSAGSHTGNKHFMAIVAKFLERYSKAETKNDKSLIVSEIAHKIHENGFFVRQNSQGVWHQVDSITAREKIGQALRDGLHSRYRSSSASKKRIRHHNKFLRTKFYPFTPP